MERYQRDFNGDATDCSNKLATSHLAMIGNPTSHQLTFSEGHGNLVVSYRADGDMLIPMQDGKDVTGWR